MHKQFLFICYSKSILKEVVVGWKTHIPLCFMLPSQPQQVIHSKQAKMMTILQNCPAKAKVTNCTKESSNVSYCAETIWIGNKPLNKQDG